MEIEYSNEVRGKVFAYRFTGVEQRHIVDALKPVVKKLEKRIDKIRNHPKNEGQATYACQIDAIRHEIKALEFIIKTLGE
jgi:Zn-dependent oligopeptidase